MRHRRHSPQFKQQVVESILAGQRSMAQVCREHALSKTLVRTWRKEYQARGPAAFVPLEEIERERHALQEQISLLEGALGRATLENEFLKRALRRAGLPFPSSAKS
jgi:transposase-like protein